MGSCLSSGRKEDARMEELRHKVEGLPTKKEREELVLHLLILFDEAKDTSRDSALANLAFVIRLIDQSQ